MTRVGDAVLLTALTLVAVALAGWMALLGRASWPEAVGFVTGALCVWLTARESVWNFPIGLANVTAFAIVFFRARLFGDAGLQIVYFALTAIGWYLWLFGGAGRTRLRISRAPSTELAVVAILALLATPVLTLYFRHVDDALPFLDALTTVLSLAAQWLLNRKYLETWYVWIAVDVLYVPMYVQRDLHLTGLLYVAFLAMAAMGLVEWFRRWRAQSTAVPGVSAPLEFR
jgi:nicotinamide mononucleotide transporter